MKINQFTGWNDVFSFTLIQTLKSKTYIISLVILCMITLCSMPLISLITSEPDPNAANSIEKVYLDNKSSISDLDFSGLHEIDQMKHIKIEPLSEPFDTVSSRVDTEENTAVILTVTDQEQNFSLDFVRASSGPVSKGDFEKLGAELVKLFDQSKLSSIGASKEQLTILSSVVSSTVTFTDTSGELIIEEDTSISNKEYWVVYGLLFVLMMINIMAGTSVATSITTEKSTRVTEYLLISIEPLALMIGKVLAMLVTTLVQMVSLVVSIVLSNGITTMISSNNQTLLSQNLPESILHGLNPINIFLCFTLFVFGLIFYATLAGLAGATVSRLEEITEGLTLFTMVNMIGVYIGLAAANVLMGGGMNTFVKFALLFPLSSPFILPGAIIVGKASLLYVLIAFALQLVLIYLLFLFVAKIYETLILHNGNTIKAKDLIKIFKSV